MSTTTVTGSRGQVAEVGEDLAGLAVRRARVDDERLAVAQDHPDVLVEERVAPHEDPVADLDPAVSDTHRRMLRAPRTALRSAA